MFGCVFRTKFNVFCWKTRKMYWRLRSSISSNSLRSCSSCSRNKDSLSCWTFFFFLKIRSKRWQKPRSNKKFRKQLQTLDKIILKEKKSYEGEEVFDTLGTVDCDGRWRLDVHQIPAKHFVWIINIIFEFKNEIWTYIMVTLNRRSTEILLKNIFSIF